MKKLNTLYLIDDDETYQFIMERIIFESSLFKNVQGFGNGMDAIQSIRRALDSPDLIPEVILLDLTMPVMDGWQFLDNYLLLKPKIGKKVIIYVVSSSVNPADVEKARNINCVTDYVVKPVTKLKFLDLINNIPNVA